MTDRFPVRLEALDIVLEPVALHSTAWVGWYQRGSTEHLCVNMYRHPQCDEVHFVATRFLGGMSDVHVTGDYHADLDTAWCQMRDVAHEWSPRLYKMIVHAEYMAQCARESRMLREDEEEMPI